MMTDTIQHWAQLVSQYEAAIAVYDLAASALDDLSPAPDVDSDEERASALSLERVCELEDGLLAITAPSVDAAIYQLKVFGLRYLSVDLDHRDAGGEDQPEGPIFRRIYEALQSLSGQSAGLV